MPQYQIGHMERVTAIEQGVSRHPGLYLTGCAYRGVGISDCIHEGERVAERVMEYLKEPGARSQKPE